MSPIVQASPTSLELEFEDGTNHLEDPKICENFTLTLKINDTPDMIQWMAVISWGPSAIEVAYTIDYTKDPPKTTYELEEEPFIARERALHQKLA